MDDIDELALQGQLAQVKALVGAALARPEGPFPPPLTAALFDFSVTSQSHPDFAQAGETARSLASLLHGWGERPPSDQVRVQVTVLCETLLQELSPATSTADVHRPLVKPIVPSQATVNQRIALYVDNASLLVLLRETLAGAGFQPVVFDSLDALAAVREDDYPAVIVAEISLCRLNPGVGDVLSNLRERLSPAPHLICLAPFDDVRARLESVRLGATRCLGVPVDLVRLLAIIRGITMQVPARPFRVITIDDDPFLAEVYRDSLESAGIEARAVIDPLHAPAVIREFRPDVIVCDIFMPGCNGLELLALLRQDDELIDTPIVLLSSDPELERRLEALNLGADDFLAKPVDMELLIAAVVARARRARMLKRSRGEVRRLAERVRELSARLQETSPEAAETEIEFDDAAETINMDDYVVNIVDLNGKRQRKKPK